MGRINNTLKGGKEFPDQYGVYWFNGKQLSKGMPYYWNDQVLIGTVIQAGTTIHTKDGKVMWRKLDNDFFGWWEGLCQKYTHTDKRMKQRWTDWQMIDYYKNQLGWLFEFADTILDTKTGKMETMIQRTMNSYCVTQKRLTKEGIDSTNWFNEADYKKRFKILSQ